MSLLLVATWRLSCRASGSNNSANGFCRTSSGWFFQAAVSSRWPRRRSARDRVRFASASRSISVSGCSFSSATSLRRKRLDCSMMRQPRKSRSSATLSWSRQTPRSSFTEIVPHSTARDAQSALGYVHGSRTQTPVREKSAPLRVVVHERAPPDFRDALIVAWVSGRQPVELIHAVHSGPEFFIFG